MDDSRCVLSAELMDLLELLRLRLEYEMAGYLQKRVVSEKKSQSLEPSQEFQGTAGHAENRGNANGPVAPAVSWVGRHHVPSWGR